MEENWHSISIEEVFKKAESRNIGLTNIEAKERVKKFGYNNIPQEKPYSKIRLFASQFNTPLMYILIFTVFISFLLRHYADTIFIIFVLLINTTVGFYQENKANKSLLLLKKMVKIRAKVLRYGIKREINSEDVVLGDIVILKAGDKVPADGRIIESKNLRINESNITGEFLSAKKSADCKVLYDAPLSDRANMVFMGTIIEEGEGKIIITATGSNTEIGKIVSLIKKTKERKTPFQRKIIHLSKFTGAFIVFVIICILAVGYFTEKSFSDIFVAALALAVSAIPEGLVPAITVVLVLGMRRILKRNGLVRKLSAAETLGSVTVICTDKTGTLTEGKMKVSHILTSEEELMGSSNNNFTGEKKNSGQKSHITALRIAVLANDAFVENTALNFQDWIVRGKPTEQALLMAGMQAGLDKNDLEKEYPVVDKISFNSKIKYAASFHRLNDKKNILYVIGAPEKLISNSNILDFNNKKEKINNAKIEKLTDKLELLTGEGLRVVACAYKECDSEEKYKDISELVKNLTFVGLIALKDPLRQDAKKSIEIAKKAGIRTVIITGDHKMTAKAVAKEIGLDEKNENIIEGKDLEAISDKELREKSNYVSIYARVSPGHKLRIIEALKDNGEIVAMLGDGVNDAPALKSADIGVSVGSGSDIAQEVSDLVLLDNNFKTVIKAIEQGRVIFENMRKVFAYLVADDFSELFLFLGSMIMGLPLPLLPMQILWINIVEDGLPDIALTTEQETEGVMDEKPRDPKEPILNKPLKRWMILIFFISGLAAFLSFLIIWKITGDIYKTRSIIFALMGLDSLIFAFSVRSFKKTIFRKDIFSNKYLLWGVIISFLFLISAIYFPLFQNLLEIQPFGIIEWAVIFFIAFIEILLIEFSKKKVFINN